MPFQSEISRQCAGWSEVDASLLVLAFTPVASKLSGHKHEA